MKHEKDVYAELGQLPKTLRESYDIIYHQIENAGVTSRQVAENAMKWLLCAQRPLYPLELIDALSIDSEGQYTPLDTSQLLHMCCNMVVLDEKLEIFRFAHLSVREYLESRGEYTKIETHTSVAEICVDTYILEPSLEPPGKQNREISPYATLYWSIHCQSIGHHQWGNRLMRKVRQFLFKDYAVAPSFIKWTSAASDLSDKLKYNSPLRADLIACSSSPPTPLFLACHFGWHSIICDMCTFRNVDWNQRNNNGYTGVNLAAANGHEAVVKVLLEKGAELESKDETWSQTPLSWAANNGHEAVVKLLLEKGAELESKEEKWGRTPLSLATETGHEAIVKLLLEKGAELESKDKKWGRAPLSWAVRWGKEAVVKLLLEKGAELESKDDIGQTPLSLAARNGSEAVVKLLLREKGAELESEDDSVGRRFRGLPRKGTRQ
jgi:ankyrin repeat protein